MKFCVENDLSLFEFHDATFSFVDFDGKDLIISGKAVNIHKNTPQNPSDVDMELSYAQITFKNFNSATYEPGRAWKTDDDGKSYPVGPRIIYTHQEAIDKITAELQEGLEVFHFEEEEKGGYSIGGCGIEPYFTIEFDFDSVIVSWNECNKKAWYELRHKYCFDSVLNTPNGDETVQLTITSDEGTVYINGIAMEPPTVSVGCKYDGKAFWGYGKDHLWIDAFADLQRKLPEGVFLKCCLTCRHGNLCPVGNDVNEVFCTKDVLITQKSDLFFYTEDEVERAKRSKQYCGLCEDYQPQSEDFYTYNDYLCFLQKA